jgi:hypothetical protein
LWAYENTYWESCHFKVFDLNKVWSEQFYVKVDLRKIPELVALKDLQSAVTPGKKLSSVKRVTKALPPSFSPLMSTVEVLFELASSKNDAMRPFIEEFSWRTAVSHYAKLEDDCKAEDWILENLPLKTRLKF